MVSGFSGHSDFVNLLYCLQRVLCDVPIVSLWSVPLPFKLECCILREKYKREREREKVKRKRKQYERERKNDEREKVRKHRKNNGDWEAHKREGGEKEKAMSKER